MITILSIYEQEKTMPVYDDIFVQNIRLLHQNVVSILTRFDLNEDKEPIVIRFEEISTHTLLSISCATWRKNDNLRNQEK